MSRFTTSAFIVGAVAMCAACNESLVGPPSGALLVGDWNGTHLSVSLAPAGGATEYDCAHGRIDGPVTLDAWGRFRAAGVHVREHGGPVREDELLDAVPATYWGRLDGELLTMRVAVGTDTLGPYLLRREAPSRLFKCL